MILTKINKISFTDMMVHIIFYIYQALGQRHENKHIGLHILYTFTITKPANGSFREHNSFGKYTSHA